MRVIAGELGGRKLVSPKGLSTRPTSDRVKEALFNILGSIVLNKEVLDLFAGSGALGIEALSRGAARSTFVDKSVDSIKVINQNIETFGLKEVCEVYNLEALGALKTFASKKMDFDLIFIDPPYSQGLISPVLNLIGNYNLIRKEGVIIVEHSKKDLLDEEYGNIERFKDRQYGDTMLSFYQFKEE